MIASLALRAPTSPPDTGASRASTPFFLASAWMRWARVGSEVVISTITEPGAAPASAPRSPRTTSSTSAG